MQETADLVARAEQLRSGPTPLEAAQAKTAELQADKAKFLDHIAGLEVCPLCHPLDVLHAASVLDEQYISPEILCFGTASAK